jgi:hypothetical protein
MGVTVTVTLAPEVPLAVRLPDAGAKLNGLGARPSEALQSNAWLPVLDRVRVSAAAAVGVAVQPTKPLLPKLRALGLIVSTPVSTGLVSGLASGAASGPASGFVAVPVPVPVGVVVVVPVPVGVVVLVLVPVGVAVAVSVPVGVVVAVSVPVSVVLWVPVPFRVVVAVPVPVKVVVVFPVPVDVVLVVPVPVGVVVVVPVPVVVVVTEPVPPELRGRSGDPSAGLMASPLLPSDTANPLELLLQPVPSAAAVAQTNHRPGANTSEASRDVVISYLLGLGELARSIPGCEPRHFGVLVSKMQPRQNGSRRSPGGDVARTLAQRTLTNARA